MSSALTTLPQSTATLWLQPDGSYAVSSTGVSGEVARQVPVTDAVCLDDLDPNGNETTDDAQALAQDLYHVLWETLGSNPDALDQGVGVIGFCSSSSLKVQSLPAIIDSQFRKDTRVVTSRTTLVVRADGTYLIQAKVQALGTIIPLGWTFSPTGGLQTT